MLNNNTIKAVMYLMARVNEAVYDFCSRGYRYDDPLIYQHFNESLFRDIIFEDKKYGSEREEVIDSIESPFHIPEFIYTEPSYGSKVLDERYEKMQYLISLLTESFKNKLLNMSLEEYKEVTLGLDDDYPNEKRIFDFFMMQNNNLSAYLLDTYDFSHIISFKNIFILLNNRKSLSILLRDNRVQAHLLSDRKEFNDFLSAFLSFYKHKDSLLSMVFVRGGREFFSFFCDDENLELNDFLKECNLNFRYLNQLKKQNDKSFLTKYGVTDFFRKEEQVFLETKVNHSVVYLNENMIELKDKIIKAQGKRKSLESEILNHRKYEESLEKQFKELEVRVNKEEDKTLREMMIYNINLMKNLFKTHE